MQATEPLKCTICDHPFQTQEELHDHNRKAHSRIAAIRRIPGGVTSNTESAEHEVDSDVMLPEESRGSERK